MHTITSIPGTAVTQKELGGILADYLTLEQTRIVRRLLTVRCGVLTAIAASISTIVHGLSWAARTGPVALFLIPPIWAWVIELRMERRLSRRLADVHGAVTHRST